MSRNQKARPSSKVVSQVRTGGVADAEKVGDIPLSHGPGGSGSVMGNVLTEGSFLQYPSPTFLESPFGQRYIATKPRAVLKSDIAVRMQMWMFDVQGFQDYGTFTLATIPGVTEGKTLLRDWYGHVRDMGKRNLKYKHLPTTLTDTMMLIYFLNVYFWVLANLTTLLNLNRLVQYSAGFAYLSVNLPQYMSRITRLWRRLSAIKAPSFIKAHAIRNGLIVVGPDLAPTVRFWSSLPLLVAGSGGPTITAISNHSSALLVSATDLGTLVANLESAERWLEVGTSAIGTDFIAMKDLIDMCSDIVPGAFETGLPDAANLPGITPEPSVYNDLLRRCYISKDIVTAGTDRWTMFPIASGVVPIIFTPAPASSLAILRGVWPPNCTITPSGFSFWYMLKTSSTVSGSK